MPGFVATMLNQVMCAHGGQATPLPLPPRVFIMGVPVVTVTHQYAVVGCALAAVASPPCATGMFPIGSLRVFASSAGALAPLVVVPNSGPCLPTSQPLIAPPAGQQRVVAS
ncbi:MAG TPA: hypothetical protein VGC36_01550 [Rhizomicrobium sp.]